MEKSNSIKKVCGFYVSSVHLVTMLLPYLNKQIEEQIEVIPFLEFDLRKNVETILSKIVLNEKNKEQILDINWKNTKVQKFTNIESTIKENVKFDNNFLSTEFWRLGLTYAPKGVFDTMSYFKDVLKIPGRRTMYKNPKLCEVTNFLGITEKDIEEETARLFDSGAAEFHDATFDTTALYLIYLKESERRANG